MASSVLKVILNSEYSRRILERQDLEGKECWQMGKDVTSQGRKNWCFFSPQSVNEYSKSKKRLFSENLIVERMI